MKFINEIEPVSTLLVSAFFVFLIKVGIAWVENDIGGEIENAFEGAGGHIEEEAHMGGNAFEVPDMGDGCGEFDMAHTFAADFGAGDFDVAAVADGAFIAYAFIFAAMAFPIAGGAEDTFAKEAVAFGFEGAVVNGLWFFHLAVGPFANFIGRGKPNAHGIEKINVEHRNPPCRD